MGEPPRLKIATFALHAARGLLRDQATRRRVMFATLLVAMLMLFAGATFLAPLLPAHEHPCRFILFWGACGWLTLTALLLAFFDLLMVRAQARAKRKDMQRDLL